MKALALLPLVLLAGCMATSVPRTRITGTIAGQPFSLESPKDSELTDLMIEVKGSDAWGGTNYTAISIGKLKANMNPEIVTTTADGMVKIMNAGSDGLGKVVGAAAK